MTTINVTADHITRGVREDCERCPVALAIIDVFPDLAYVSVGSEALSLQRRGDDTRTDLDVPCDVLNFVWDFDDNTGPVQPFSFDLDYPAEAVA
jgi:hypothetical protein